MADRFSNMKSVLLRFFYCFLILLFSQSALSAWNQGSIDEEKAKAVKRLERRKMGFEKYLAQQKEWDKKRVANAFKQKEIRKKHSERKEKARLKFVRKTQSFPEQAYRNFLKKRRKIQQSLRKAREDYRVVQKELRKVFKNKKYRISGKKEFKL